MGLLYSSASANFNGAGMTITGDGTSTVLVVDFTKAPFGVDFLGNLPAVYTYILGEVFTDVGPDDSYSAVFAFSGTVATITLNKALPSGVTIPLNFAFAYGTI